MVIHTLLRQPYPVLFVELPGHASDGCQVSGASDLALELHTQLGVPALTAACRGVPLDALGRVLRHGTDLVPTDAPAWFGDFTKAIEYGGIPKVVMMFRRASLRSTYVEVAATDVGQLERLAPDYPTRRVSVDGSMVWCSRFAHDDPRVASAYECEYARWIPGDAREALIGVLVVARPQDRDALTVAIGAPDV